MRELKYVQDGYDPDHFSVVGDPDPRRDKLIARCEEAVYGPEHWYDLAVKVLTTHLENFLYGAAPTPQKLTLTRKDLDLIAEARFEKGLWLSGHTKPAWWKWPAHYIYRRYWRPWYGSSW